MDLKTYLHSLPMGDRLEFSARAGTTYGHLRNVSYGQKPCSPELAIAIERESGGKVRCEDLNDTADWAYIRSTTPVQGKTPAVTSA